MQSVIKSIQINKLLKRFNAQPVPMFEQIGIIGCGLMGGSFALAMKHAKLCKRVVGYSKSPSTTAKALEMGIIDTEAASALQAVAGSDLVLIAVPVGAMESTFRAIKHLVTPDVLLMDVGSTKQDVVDAAHRALGESVGSFVPAHPVAGKESSGVEASDANLYYNKKVILTPNSHTLPHQLSKAQDLWVALGCKVSTMPPKVHDAAFAAVSHLPHLLAFAMMNSMTEQTNGFDYLTVAGSGFRDFTRIAASEPTMWHDILLANKIQILSQVNHFKSALLDVETALKDNDSAALAELINQASQSRFDWQRRQS